MLKLLYQICFSIPIISTILLSGCASQSTLNKTQNRQLVIDSTFTAMETMGLNTSSRLKYIYHFSDRDRIPIQELAAGLEKDSIHIINISPEQNQWHLTAFENAVHNRASIMEKEKEFKWMMYKYKVDHYHGFRILPADIDFTMVPADEFISFLNSLPDEDLYNVAGQLSKANDHLRAIAAYDELIKRNFYPDTSHFQMGRSLIGINEYVEGIGHWEQALEHNPKYLEVHMELGKIYFENSHWKKAYKHFAESNRIKPNDDMILYHLSKGLIRLERYEEAYLVIRESLRVNSKNVFARGVLKQLRSPAMKKLRKDQAAKVQ